MEILVIVLITGAAIAAVLVPLLQRGPASDPMLDTEATDPSASGGTAAQALEEEIRRYREALRAGTVCRKCGAANPPDSRFCAECGRPIGSHVRKRVA